MTEEEFWDWCEDCPEDLGREILNIVGAIKQSQLYVHDNTLKSIVDTYEGVI